MVTIVSSPRLMAIGEAASNGVVNDAGEDVGKIEEFVMDVDNGRIAYAVLSFGGFMGVGEKWFAIPWDALKPSLHDKKFVLKAGKETLKGAFGFNKGQRPDYCNPEWANSVYSHFGYRPYWIKD